MTRQHTRVRVSEVAALLIMMALTSAFGCGPARGAPRIILISIDSLRRDRLGCYGAHDTRTPTLDRLAREGTWLTACASTSSWTLPSHMSMLTGLLPEKHGVSVDRKALDPRRTLLQEMLSEAGFATAGFVSSPFLDARYGFARGFDTYRNFWGGEEAILDSLELKAGGRSDVDFETIRREALRSAHDERTGPAVIDASIRWLRQNQSKPFFLFVHLWEPHYDYLPPPPYERLFVPRGYQPRISMRKYFYNADIHAGMPREDLRYVWSQYDGEVAYADHLIGELVTALEDLKIDRETLIIVTADHGEEFFEHGQKGHRATLYDESILVPFIVRGPEVTSRPNGIDNAVSLTDIAPTVLGMLSMARHHEMRGFDLGPLLEDDGRAGSASHATRAVAVSQLLHAKPPSGRLCDQFSTRTLHWKAIRNCSDSLEIFDLWLDPREASSRSADRLPESNAVGRACDSLRAALVAEAALLPNEGTSEVEIDAALRERLDALGYLK